MVNNYKYINIPLKDVTESMIKDCIETSRDTLRLSNDGKNAILKWEIGNRPLWSKELQVTIRAHEDAKTYYNTTKLSGFKPTREALEA